MSPFRSGSGERPPAAICPTCGSQMWLAMAPPKAAEGLKEEDWLFRCPVCEVIVPVAQTLA
jgi:hypothetical protein